MVKRRGESSDHRRRWPVTESESKSLGSLLKPSLVAPPCARGPCTRGRRRRATSASPTCPAPTLTCSAPGRCAHHGGTTRSKVPPIVVHRSCRTPSRGRVLSVTVEPRARSARGALMNGRWVQIVPRYGMPKVTTASAGVRSLRACRASSGSPRRRDCDRSDAHARPTATRGARRPGRRCVRRSAEPRRRRRRSPG